MKHLLTTIAIALIPSSLVWAGSSTFQGEGRILADADRVELSVSVVSECYPTAKLATEANDETSLAVMTALKRYATTVDAEDGVFSRGGFTERSSSYDAERRIPVCVNTFRKTNSVLLRTSSVDTFARDFAAIQDELYSLRLDQPVNVISQPVSFLTIGMPSPGLRYDHYRKLELQTIAMAVQNAKQKFEASMLEANVTSYKIISYDESGSMMPYPTRGADWKSAPIANGGEAPLDFDQLTVLSRLTVKFEF